MKRRLTYITNLIERDYDDVWDICCDHGKLGISLLTNKKINKVHFVDCIPSIIDNLNSKLLKMDLLDSSNLEVHLSLGEDLIIDNTNTLVCICGVGGETAIEIMTGLLNNNDLSNTDILLSIQYRTVELRKFLLDNFFKMKKELICFEGKWAHQIFMVSLKHGEKIDLIGKHMFNKEDPLHLNFIQKNIIHYTKKSVTDDKLISIVNLYKDLL